MYGVIYKTLNVHNKNLYVGQSIFPKRISEDLFPIDIKRYIGSGKILKDALKKYPLDDKLGADFWVTEIIDEADTKEELNEKEIKWIIELKPEYNLTKGGDGWRGIHTIESRIKMSETKKDPKWIEKHREQLSKASKGRPAWNKGKIGIYSEETRKKISENSSHYWRGKKRPKISEEHRRKLSESHKGQIPWIAGKHHSEESKEKMSKANKGKPGYWTGKHLSIEHRKRLSEKTKEYYKKLKENLCV